MAQLRDARTSALMAEDTPAVIALLADSFDPADVLFDDVGQAFDPVAVREAHRDDVAGLTAAAAAAKSGSNERKGLEAAVAQRQQCESRAVDLRQRAERLRVEARRLVD